ncbi:hypothetical protein TNCV_4772861 [Trichonephila clavipes]|nr:hypothetical protein TNCV_4772861 [Trichonephila clavipes]
MKSAFNQIPLHFRDKHKTAFSTPDGVKYEFNRLCFGLKNSPKAFQSIAQVLGDLLHNGALVYIDDIILFTKTIDELLNYWDTPFEWTSETQEAFDDIKEAILNPPVLALPDPNAELRITTDASSRDDRERLFPEGWEKKVNHDVRVDQIKKTPTTKRGGRTNPKARTLYRSRAPAGRGEERRKESGTAEGSESRR